MPSGSRHARSQHLVAAADAEHHAAAPRVCLEVDLPAAAAQRVEVGDGGFRARQNDEIGIGGNGLAEREKFDLDIRLQAQRIEVVEVGDARIGEHDDAHACRWRLFAHRLERQRVLGRQPVDTSEMRHQPEIAPTGQCPQLRAALIEQRRIAAELIDDETLDEARVRRVQHCLRPRDAGDDAAAADVTDEHDRHVGGARKAHVGDVAAPQVDLRRRAGPFDQHDVRLGAQAPEAVAHGVEQLRLHVLVGRGLGVADDAALHDHLGADLALRFQQHRVHVHARSHAGSARLQRLGTADLAAVRRYRGIVRHVLRLERAHAQAASRKQTRQSRDKRRLADV